MSESHSQSLFDRIPPFSLLLTMAVLLVVGAALLPGMELSDKPDSVRGSRFDISFTWSGASPEVVEQEVTSRIEGLMASVKGVETVSSVSRLGSGRVRLELKKGADVPMMRFEVSSLLRQLSDKLPEGVSYPQLSGGELQDDGVRPETVTLLSYRVNADMDGDRIREYLEGQLRPLVEHLPEVSAVGVTGGTSQYLEITCDPLVLRNGGLTMSDVAEGLRHFLGREQLVGDVDEIASDGSRQRITLLLETYPFGKDVGQVPLKTVNGKTVYLNSLATWEYRDKLPSRYYRVNGLNTVYMNVEVDARANLIRLSREIRPAVERLKPQLREGVYLTLVSDASEETDKELHKLVRRTGMSLLILLAFVWAVSRNWKYLLVVFATLLTDLLTAVIVCRIAGIRLHIYSLAGVTVSFGMIIDASIVMIDHYGRYHDRKAFLPVLAALLTTIGSLIVVFFLPGFIRRDLYDFSRIVIVNLCVALAVSLLFVPPLCDSLRYDSRQPIARLHRSRLILGWTRFYPKYLAFTQRYKWMYLLGLLLAFGIPFYALPDQVNKRLPGTDSRPDRWYESLYNHTLGGRFYQQYLDEPLSKTFGGTMRLFAQSIKNGPSRDEDQVPVLTIRGRMPLGGSIHQLNEKVLQVEQFLAGFDGIRRFETNITGDARITVEFEEEAARSSFPYYLESQVIGKLLDIGGADWSTSGVSPRGFSNSIDLTYRSECLMLTGYNYQELLQYARRLAERMESNRRVRDLLVENSRSGTAVDELYMEMDEEMLSLYGIDRQTVYASLREILSETEVGCWVPADGWPTDIRLVSSRKESHDLWQLQNSYLHVADGTDQGREVRLTDLGSLSLRKAKNSISRENQEYALYVSYNYLGSFESKNRYVNALVDETNAQLPVGYRCRNRSVSWHEDDGTQYWLILLIVVIVFFVCAILFESLAQPFAIILMVPVSFIGTFLTYAITKLPFGTGGFASLVLLCGLVVNAGIYIVCEFNTLRPRGLPRQDGLDENGRIGRYVKAYNHKIVPVFLTVLSTVLGLVPFFFEGVEDTFWFSFAVGTAGGLLFSLLALVFVLPVFLPLAPRRRAAKHCRI